MTDNLISEFKFHMNRGAVIQYGISKVNLMFNGIKFKEFKELFPDGTAWLIYKLDNNANTFIYTDYIEHNGSIRLTYLEKNIRDNTYCISDKYINVLIEQEKMGFLSKNFSDALNIVFGKKIKEKQEEMTYLDYGIFLKKEINKSFESNVVLQVDVLPEYNLTDYEKLEIAVKNKDKKEIKYFFEKNKIKKEDMMDDIMFELTINQSLMSAVLYADVGILELLLDNVNYKSGKLCAYSPLSAACYIGDFEKITLFLKNKNVDLSVNKSYPILTAVKNNDDKLLNVLMNNKSVMNNLKIDNELEYGKLIITNKLNNFT